MITGIVNADREAVRMYGYKLTVEDIDGGEVTIELLLNP